MAAECRDALEHCWPRRKPGAIKKEGVERSWLFISVSHFHLLARGSVNTESLSQPNSRQASRSWRYKSFLPSENDLESFFTALGQLRGTGYLA
jgi:hypothetical protein